MKALKKKNEELLSKLFGGACDTFVRTACCRPNGKTPVSFVLPVHPVLLRLHMDAAVHDM